MLRRTVLDRLTRSRLTPVQIGLSRRRMDALGRLAALPHRPYVRISQGQLGGVPVRWCESRLPLC